MRIEPKYIAACGNDCAACPRYTVHPFEKTPEELHHVAELWKKIGYRDTVVSNEEIACQGCRPENWCRYHIAECCAGHGIANCSQCQDYPCDTMKKCLAVTLSFAPRCKEVCTAEEYAQLAKAFFTKEENLQQLKHEGPHHPQS